MGRIHIFVAVLAISSGAHAADRAPAESASPVRQAQVAPVGAKPVGNVLIARTFEAKPGAPEWVRELIARLPELRQQRLEDSLDALRKTETAANAADAALDKAKKRPVNKVRTEGTFGTSGRQTDAADVEAKAREVKAAKANSDQANSDRDLVLATIREIQLDQQSGLLGPLTADYGSVGIFVNGHVEQVVDENVVLMRCEGFEVMLRKYPTVGLVDGKVLTLKAPVRITGTEKYQPRAGQSRTIYTAEPVDLVPYLNVTEVKVTSQSLDAEIKAMLAKVAADDKARKTGVRTGLTPR